MLRVFTGYGVERAVVSILCAFLAAFLWFHTALAGEGQGTGLPRAAINSDFVPVRFERVLLGRLLFFDPILSGNRNIACSTCHHPRFATGDGLALGIGEGGTGLGPDRKPTKGNNRPEQRIGRNAPALFNLGAQEFQVMFHDGRLEVDPSRPSGLRTPLEEEMVAGFSGALAAQTMFPVLSPDEMAGHYTENEIAKAVRTSNITGPDGAWALLTARIAAISDYVAMFQAAFDHINRPSDIHFTDIANAIAEFIVFEWRSTDSPFDQYLAGHDAALTAAAKRGMVQFYGEAGCAGCHAGLFQTDHQFHAIAMPQFGPGKTARFETRPVDMGRLRVTGKAGDAYRFRTPSLRNVAQTAPYGHSGAYSDLASVIRHHQDPVRAFNAFDPDRVSLPAFAEAARTDTWATADARERGAILAANELAPTSLSKTVVADLIAFLHALSDQTALTGRLGVPAGVPSGLPVE